MKKSLLALGLSAASLLQGCGSSTVDSDKVAESEFYREMNVVYDAEKGSTEALIQFSVAGFQGPLSSATTVALVGESSVEINGKKPKFSDARKKSDLMGEGSYYVAALDEKEAVEFSWTKRDGEVLKEVVDFPKAAEISLGDESPIILKSHGITVQVAGPELSEDEDLEVTIRLDRALTVDEIKTDVQSYVTKDPSKMGEVIFSALDLAKLGTGSAEISVNRRLFKRVSKVSKNSEYIGKTIKVEITN